MVKKTTLNEVGEMLTHVVEHMVTKGELTTVLENYPTKTDLVEVLKNYPTKDDLAETVKDFAKKIDLEKFKEDILGEIRPIGKAFDKDAVTLIDHGKRIVVLEQKAGIAAK